MPFVFNFCDLGSANAVAYYFPDSKRSKSVTGITGIIYVSNKFHTTFLLHIYDLKCSSYAFLNRIELLELGGLTL